MPCSCAYINLLSRPHLALCQVGNADNHLSVYPMVSDYWPTPQTPLFNLIFYYPPLWKRITESLASWNHEWVSHLSTGIFDRFTYADYCRSFRFEGYLLPTAVLGCHWDLDSFPAIWKLSELRSECYWSVFRVIVLLEDSLSHLFFCKQCHAVVYQTTLPLSRMPAVHSHSRIGVWSQVLTNSSVVLLCLFISSAVFLGLLYCTIPFHLDGDKQSELTVRCCILCLHQLEFIW